MLTGEALILLATLAASGLLVLGVVELVWPSTPRRPARHARIAPPPRFDAAPVPTFGGREIAHTEPDLTTAPAARRSLRASA